MSKYDYDDDQPRPDCPQASFFRKAFCADPNCGLHLISCDKNDVPVIETVFTPQQTLELIEDCQRFLYEKATRRSGDHE